MARFGVYAPPSRAMLLLDVQADLLDPLNTRVVVPLMPIDAAPTPARRLNPVFDIEGRRLVMVTQFLSAVRVAELGRPVARIEARRDEITAALDMLFQGF
jgi:toxin CcdB